MSKVDHLLISAGGKEILINLMTSQREWNVYETETGMSRMN